MWHNNHSQQYKLISQINDGGFGVVYKAEFKGREIAVKVLNTTTSASKLEFARLLLQEAETMLAMKHERIVTFYDVDFNTCSLLMELMSHGSLYTYIQNNTTMKFADKNQLILDVLEGMAYLHSPLCSGGKYKKKEVFHQDLKTGNVLLGVSNGTLRGKISDFGLSQVREIATATAGKSSKVMCNGGTACYQFVIFISNL
jgi:serine/threonine protein kinase